jgi:16S rRNA (cytosine967-C5)-methyltransferase
MHRHFFIWVSCTVMKYFSHLNTALQILQQYDGQQPFVYFIKKFFSADKKYGSKDRRNISQLCYAYFRLGKALLHLPMEERILVGLHACSPAAEELREHLQPAQPVAIPVTDIFPWQEALSEGIDYQAFCFYFLVQPDLFLRLRPGAAQLVKAKLQQANIPFKEMTATCLALPNASKVDTVIDIDREAVIQDYTSQRIGEFLTQIPKPVTVWDACAASGGKAILAYDLLKPIDLTVSDVRDTILINLEKRFTNVGIKNYNAFIADLVTLKQKIPFGPFDLIIADVPCSGSGTWSRTPEQLFYFDTTMIDTYQTLQKKIVHNIIPYMKAGGYFLYITCSVFKKENEDLVQYIQEQHGLRLLNMQLLKGYDQKADTMFAALFTAGE